MTTTDNPIPVGPGDVLHCLGSVLVFGNAWKRGDTFTLSREMVQATVDLNGDTWLDDLSESAQVRRWGEPRIGVGPWPEDLLHPWVPGSRDEAEARELARKRAHRLDDPEAKRQALAEVQRVFGAAPTSQTLNKAANPSARLADDQRARLDAEGVRSSSKYAPHVRVNP
jgi:hypothetical protein